MSDRVRLIPLEEDSRLNKPEQTDFEQADAPESIRPLSYMPLVLKREKSGAGYTSKLRTPVEGAIPAKSALHEFKKSCNGRLELLGCLTILDEDFNSFS